MPLLRLVCRKSVVCTALALSSLPVRAETQIVQVEALDGRSLQGEVDERSDEDRLWIRRTEGSVILASSVAWDDIRGIVVDGQPVGRTVLQGVYQELATPAPAAFLTEFESLQSAGVSVTPEVRPIGRIRSIDVDAGIVNLDRTVETDGLLMSLVAVDELGRAVAVPGSISARLIVERLDQHTGQVSFEEFQRWSASVVAADFHDGIVEVPLRYRRLSPEFRWDLCTAALLNVRFGVPGQGNFEASVPIAIQEFNPIRDEMRNQQGSRFYRDELTRNTRHDGPQQLYRGYSPARGYGF